MKWISVVLSMIMVTAALAHRDQDAPRTGDALLELLFSEPKPSLSPGMKTFREMFWKNFRSGEREDMKEIFQKNKQEFFAIFQKNNRAREITK